jgi:hypothetical protein
MVFGGKARSMPSYDVEPDVDQTSGVCECCSNISRQITGFVHELDATRAGYSVHWTVGRFPDHPANIDLIVGGWGEDGTPDQRYVVSMLLTVRDDRPDIIVIDAKDRPIARKADLVGRALDRNEVIGTPRAKEIFDLIDAIFLNDPRLPDLVHNRIE